MPKQPRHRHLYGDEPVEAIADLLMQAGRDSGEKLTIVTHATMPEQRVVTGTLEMAAALAAK